MNAHTYHAEFQQIKQAAETLRSIVDRLDRDQSVEPDQDTREDICKASNTLARCAKQLREIENTHAACYPEPPRYTEIKWDESGKPVWEAKKEAAL